MERRNPVMPRERKFDTWLVVRRQYIFRRVVLDNRPLPISEIQKLFPLNNYTKSEAVADAGEFKAVGCEIKLRPSQDSPKELEFVFTEGSHTDDDTVRERINEDEKHLAAKLAAATICGLPKVSEDQKSLLPNWLDDDVRRAFYQFEASASVSSKDKELASRVKGITARLAEMCGAQQGKFPVDSHEAILDLLNKSTVAHRDRTTALRGHLRKFWAERSRLIAIDSGTTNITLAKYLAHLQLPLTGSSLCSLTVCSNSRKIFEVLGPANVAVKTIIIGGQQKFRSPTIAGAMAEIFLKSATLLQFGMCIIGSTKVDLEHFAVCSDSQEESSLKNLLMERSSLRIILVDDSKFQTGPGREGYKFCSIDPKHIDLVITNSPLRPLRGKERIKSAEIHFEAFCRMIRMVEARGVPVLVATSSRTFPHPALFEPTAPTQGAK